MSRCGPLVAALLATASAVHAQTWTADVYAGGTRYQSLSDRVSATNLIANVRYEGVRSLLAYLSAAVPLDGDAALWGAAGGAGRLTRFTLRPWSYGIELAAHGYGFRDRLSDDLGGGVSGYALPFVAFAHDAGTIELRGGWHQHAFGYADTTGTRGLAEAAARVSAGRDGWGLQLEGRALRATDATYPYVGVQVAAAPAIARLWAWTGRWFGDERPGTEWGVGGSIAIGRVGEVWAGIRQDASDPLFQNAPRRAWNLGFSRQLSSRRAATAALAPKVQPGAVQIRLPRSAVPQQNGGPPLVAGEFNDWQPAPMRDEDGVWVLDLPLGPGVYRFAFVTPSGEWFVPEQYPGRMDDGMGGHVALLVIS